MTRFNLSRETLYLITIVILLLGTVFLRFYNIDKQGFWQDEAVTIDESNREVNEIIDVVKDKEAVPPLYFIILSKWIKAFGLTEFSTRFLSALFGILIFVICFLIFSELTNRKDIILLSLILVTLFVTETVYSQLARYYTFFNFFVLLSTYFLIKIIKNNEIRKYKYLYAVSSIVVVFSSYIGYFVLMMHFFTILFFERINKTKFKLTRLIQIFTFLLGAIWSPYVIKQYLAASESVREVFLGFGFPNFIAKLGYIFLIFPGIIIFLICIYVYYKISKNKIPRINLTDWQFSLLVLLALAFELILLNLLIKPLIVLRYFTFFMPFVYFLFSKRLFSLRNKKIRYAILILILIVQIFALGVYYTKTTHAEWREAVDFIKETNEVNKGVILLDEGTGNKWLADYYYKDPVMQVIPLSFRKEKQKETVMTDEEVKDIIKDKEVVWLALSRNYKRGYYFRDLLEKELGKWKLEKKFVDIEVYLYEKRKNN